MSSKKGKIGVFDSGFGGLSILRHLVKVLPSYDYLYFGDSARAPYGLRSQEIIYDFTTNCLDFMFQSGCEIVILACNTASSEALRKIQQEFLPKKYPDKKVLGVIIPAVEDVLEKNKSKVIGVMATPATIRSKAFEREIKNRGGIRYKVFGLACPLLVPIVESGDENTLFAKDIISKYVNTLMKKNIDTLVLGCTHYELLLNKIKQAIPKTKKVFVVSEGNIVAKKLKDYLSRHKEIESKLSKSGRREYMSTDFGDNFEKLGSKFFGSKIKAKKISL